MYSSAIRRARGTLLVFLLFLAACDSNDVSESDPELVQMSDLLVEETALADGLTLNPSGRTPLAAHLAIDARVPVSVDLEVLGERPLTRSFDDVVTAHSLPLLGLYADRENRVVIRLTDPEERRYAVDTLAITTPPLPDTFPNIEIQTSVESMMEPGWNLSSLAVSNDGSFLSYPIIFDQDGAIRWYLDLSEFGELSILTRRLENGHFAHGVGPSIYEYDLLGNEVNRLTIAGYRFHHDFVEKPDGNLIVAVDKEGVGSVEDHVVEIDRLTGAVLREWDLRQILDVDRFDLVESAYDWFHMNSVWYLPEEDALILSGRNQGVVKVDGNNNLVWILAPHRGWSAAGLDGQGHDTRDFLLSALGQDGSQLSEDVQLGTAVSSEFDWAWGQHAAMTLGNGNLYLFDNGFQRRFGDSPLYSRGVEYEIDEDAMTVRQVWEYGEQRGPEFYSSIISDVDITPEQKNRIIMPGFISNGSSSHAYMTEVTHPGNMVVFDARFDFKVVNGSGAGWGQIDIVYRSERLHIYPEGLGSAETVRPEDAAPGKYDGYRLTRPDARRTL